MNFLAKSLYSLNPTEANLVLIMASLSGNIIDTHLNNTFKFSGSSYLPAYPGFIVTKKAHCLKWSIGSGSPGKLNLDWPNLLAKIIASICIATTDNTYNVIRLNSSKSPHHPDILIPLNNLAISLNLCWSEQFVTTTYCPNVLPRSFTVSVFPVPAGPAGAPPYQNESAYAHVMYHLSVKGVIQSLYFAPKYS